MEKTIEERRTALERAINQGDQEQIYDLLSKLRQSKTRVSLHLLPVTQREPESVAKRAQALRTLGVPIPACQEIAQFTKTTKDAIQKAEADGLIDRSTNSFS